MGSSRSTTAAEPTPTLGDQQLVALGKRLLAYAHRYAGAAGLSTGRREATVNAQALEDLVEDCILTLIDPKSERHWNPVTSPDPMGYLISVFNSKLSHAKQRATRTREIDEDDEPLRSGFQSTPETLLVAREREEVGRQAHEALLAHIIDNEALTEMFDLIESGVEKSSEIAKRMGVDVKVVYNLSKQLDRHYEKVASHIRTELQLDGDSDG